MTEGKKPHAHLTKSITTSTDTTSPQYENKSESYNTEKDATTEFIFSSGRKFRAIIVIAAIALGCHVIAYVFERIGVDSFVVGVVHFIEYVAAIGDAIWIVVLIVREVCNAITEMLTGRFKMIAFGVVLFASGAVLSPHIRDGLLLLLRKVSDLLAH